MNTVRKLTHTGVLNFLRLNSPHSLASTVASVWIPLAGELTPANRHDNTVATTLIEQLPLDARFVLGDNHYKTDPIQLCCRRSNRILVGSGRGPYPRHDSGVKVRQLFHQLRSKSIEPFNQLFKSTFDWHGQVPVKGLLRTQLFVLGAVLLYQLALLYQFQRKLPLARGIKPLLKAA